MTLDRLSIWLIRVFIYFQDVVLNHICRIWDASFIIRHTHWFTKPTHKEIHKTLSLDTQVAQNASEIAIKHSAARFFSVSLNFVVLTLRLLTKPRRKDMVCTEHCGSRIRSNTVNFFWPPQRCTRFGNVDDVEFTQAQD